MKKKILITGASGFIGFNTLIELLDNNNITIILRKKNSQITKLRKKHKFNIIYYKSFNKLNLSLKKINIDYVVHCATHYIKNHSYDDIFNMNSSNLLFGNIILENLRSLLTFSNNILQGDFRGAGNTAGRFTINTTVGILGVFDPASKLGFEKESREDFGQTLAVYGVEPGPYLVLPLLGPSTVRDALGKVTGFVADPVTIALNKDGKENWLWIGTAVNGIDFREQNLEKIDNLEATSVDFYATIRSLYLERRNRMIRNQSADEQDPFQEFDIE